MTIRCPDCQHESPDTAYACSQCGNELPKPTPESRAPNDFRKSAFGNQGTVHNDASDRRSYVDQSKHVHVTNHGPQHNDEPASLTLKMGKEAVIGLVLFAALVLGAVMIWKPEHTSPTGQAAPMSVTVVQPAPIEAPSAAKTNAPIQPPNKTPPVVPVVAKALKLELNQTTFAVNDRLSVTIDVPTEGYLYVMSIEANGECTPLYPTDLVASDAHVPAGKVLHLPGDLPLAADGSRVVWPMAFPDGFSQNQEVTESIVAFLSPTPRQFPKKLGKLADTGFRTRGPRPQTIRLDSGLISFEGLPQTAAHYTIHR